jgi:carbamoyl-phosphate synthase small subunit
MRALLALEDGVVFHGRAFGASAARGGEVVFNTSMTGYQEILTDPSYFGQIVVFTAPHLGNYGIHEREFESDRPRAVAVVTREVCFQPTHPAATTSLPAYLRAHDCFGLTGVDTRALTLHLRNHGSLRGWLTPFVESPEEAVERARSVPPMEKVPAVDSVTTAVAYQWHERAAEHGGAPLEGGISSVAGAEPPATAAPPRDAVRLGTASLGTAPLGTIPLGAVPLGAASASAASPAGLESRSGAATPRVAVLDFGVKFNILRELSVRGCQVTILPAGTDPALVERLGPDGVVLSNGPGDPRSLGPALPAVTRLIERFPTLAICLGHQLAGLALGCRIVKLPFGHHGGNHPVQNLETRKVAITAQNHNYAIDGDGLPEDIQVTHRNLNDGTVEGMRHRSLPLWSLQFHPEASPGPHEASAVFDEFVAYLRRTPREAERGVDHGARSRNELAGGSGAPASRSTPSGKE